MALKERIYRREPFKKNGGKNHRGDPLKKHRTGKRQDILRSEEPRALIRYNNESINRRNVCIIRRSVANVLEKVKQKIGY